MKHGNNSPKQVLKPGFEVDAEPVVPISNQPELLRPPVQIDIQADLNEHCEDNDSENSPETDKVKSPSHRFGSKWLWLGLAVLTLGIVELIIFVERMFSQQDWLSVAWLIVLASVIVFALAQLFNEWRGLTKLKQRENSKHQAIAMHNAPSMGQGEAYCESLSVDLNGQYSHAIKKWQQGLKPHHIDSEIVSLFELQVLKEADKKAIKCVTQHASASAAMIAVSPFALLDMAVVLWRNLRMLKQVSRCYGIELTYWGRISLVKQVFKTMLVAGAAEIVSDAGSYALGAGATGKISSRLAQGLGAGILTSRIGIKAMHACRPLPWVALKKPGSSELATQIVSDLKKIVK